MSAMHPTTHILAGWCLAELDPTLSRRGKAAIVIAAGISDLDGLGVIAEVATRNSSRPLLWWTEYHHVVGHNLLFAALFGIAAALTVRGCRARTALWCFIAVHLHYLGDVLGSRGPDEYQWPIAYLYPFRDEPQLAWSGQWYLNAWPNFAITAVLLTATMFLAWRRGHSVVGLASFRADQAFVSVLRKWFGPQR